MSGEPSALEPLRELLHDERAGRRLDRADPSERRGLEPGLAEPGEEPAHGLARAVGGGPDAAAASGGVGEQAVVIRALEHATGVITVQAAKTALREVDAQRGIARHGLAHPGDQLLVGVPHQHA